MDAVSSMTLYMGQEEFRSAQRMPQGPDTAPLVPTYVVINQFPYGNWSQLVQ
jgi:hypothetical protein